MPKSAFTDAYASVIELLVALRKERGVSQVELARRLGRTQQYVSYLERRERRLDIVEFYLVCRALGEDPEAIFGRAIQRFPGEIEMQIRP